MKQDLFEKFLIISVIVIAITMVIIGCAVIFVVLTF